MTKAGLYHYFDSKEALLFEIMTYGLERVRDEVVAAGARHPRSGRAPAQQIACGTRASRRDGRGAVAHLGDEIRALPPAARRQIEERMRVYFDLIRDTLRELKDAGRLRDIDPTVAAFSLLGMILWLPRWFRQDGRLSQEQVAERDREAGGQRARAAAAETRDEAASGNCDASDVRPPGARWLQPSAQIPPRHRYLTSRNSSRPYFEPSRPRPDSLTPPNGATSVEISPVLMPTMPYSSASATRQMRPMSRP